MTLAERRCANCGNPLQPEDTTCPSCGAAVNPEELFPKAEEFMHPSYQNVEAYEVPPATSTQPEAQPDVEPVPEVVDLPLRGGAVRSAQPAYTPPYTPAGEDILPEKKDGWQRGCLIACGVIALVGLCCVLSLGLVLWFTGDVIVEFLRQMGIVIF
jgi:hypothetical protein